MNVEFVTTAALVKEARAFRPNKQLGQHFLVDVDALQKIVETVDPKPGENVIEIGPGIGFLTRYITQSGASITGVDLDRLSVDRLKQQNLANLVVKHGDILQFDLNSKDFFNVTGDIANTTCDAPGNRMKVVGNVPYQITGAIIGHLLGELDRPSPWIHSIDSIVLTVQYEVAQRLVAEPGDRDYSRVSLLIKQFCRAEMIAVLPPASFFPPPQVSSAVVKLLPLDTPLVRAHNMTLLRQLVQAGFRQRRKMFRNALSFLRLPQSEIDTVFQRLQMDPQVRAERLSLQQFAILADAINELAANAQDHNQGPRQN